GFVTDDLGVHGARPLRRGAHGWTGGLERHPARGAASGCIANHFGVHGARPRSRRGGVPSRWGVSMTVVARGGRLVVTTMAERGRSGAVPRVLVLGSRLVVTAVAMRVSSVLGSRLVVTAVAMRVSSVLGGRLVGAAVAVCGAVPRVSVVFGR